MNNKAFEIKIIKESDWQTFKDIRLRSLKDSPEAFGYTYDQASKESDQQWQDRCKTRPNQKALPLLAEIDGEPCGVIWGVIRSPKETTANVYKMWVSPDARGLGVGRALLETIINWSREQGMESVTLGVYTSNAPAIALYKSLGFKPCGEASIEEGSDERIQDMILLT